MFPDVIVLIGIIAIGWAALYELDRWAERMENRREYDDERRERGGLL